MKRLLAMASLIVLATSMMLVASPVLAAPASSDCAKSECRKTSPAARTCARRQTQHIVVSLGHYSENIHAVAMALKIATGLQSKGAKVSLFLNLEAVRLADKRQPQRFSWDAGPTVGELYKGFVAAGGTVLVCPHCAKSAGITPTDLADGATITTSEAVMDLFLDACKVISY